MTDARLDSEELLNAVVPLAKKMLNEHGEFYPYGGVMKPNGQIVSVGAREGNEHPPSPEVVDLLREGFKTGAQSNEYKATAIVCDVTITLPGSEDKSDAIAVALDHRDNYSVVVLLPYRIADGEVEYGEILAQAGENDIFS